MPENANDFIERILYEQVREIAEGGLTLEQTQESVVLVSDELL